MRSLILGAILLFGLFSTAYGGYCENKEYQPYDLETNPFSVSNRLKKLVEKGEGFATLFSMGTRITAEGREIKGLVITDPTSTATKASVVVTGNIHANEWIGAEVAIGLAEYLISNRINEDSVFGTSGSESMNIKKLLENVEIYIAPVLNPDGYEYSRHDGKQDTVDEHYNRTVLEYWSEESDPVYGDWRKNRSVNPSLVTDPTVTINKPVGVDCNRNFEKFWDDPVSKPTDTITNPNAYLTYRGPSAASEVETQAEQNLILASRAEVVIDFHSGKQLVLYPWAHTICDPEAECVEVEGEHLRPGTDTMDKDLFKEMARKMAEYMGNDYVARQSYNEGAVSTGVARDFAYEAQKAAAFLLELSRGYHPSEISLYCNENTIKGVLWPMFWAADQGFRSRPKLHLGEPTDVLVK